MNNSRESIAVALFNMFSTNPAFNSALAPNTGFFKTVSRSTKLFANVPSAIQPAFFLRKEAESYVYPAQGTPGYLLLYGGWVYCSAKSDSNTIYETVVNNCLDLIDSVINPVGTRQMQRLITGGKPLVGGVWMEGHVPIDDGAVSEQMQFAVPIIVSTGI